MQERRAPTRHQFMSSMIPGLFGSLWLVLSGCGGDHPSSGAATNPGPSGPLSRQTFANAYAKARCDGYVRCNCVWSELGICSATGVCPTAQNCVTVMAADEEHALASLDGLAVEFSVELGQACLDAITSADCGALAPGPCDPLFLGTLPLGASCKSRFECVGWEKSQADCQGGVCVVGGFAGAHLTAGSSCNATATPDPQSASVTIHPDDPATDPAQYLTCYTSDGLACISGVCAAPKPIGSGCLQNTDCVAGSVCNVGTCGAPLPPGATCTSNALCAPGTYCTRASDVATSLTCQAQSANGTACGGDEECVSGYCYEQVCKPSDTFPVCDT